MNHLTGEILMFHTGYNHDTDAVSRETGVACPPDESQTQQQFAEDADINTIVRRFGLTGEMPQNFHTPLLGDFSQVHDFQSAMNVVRAAEESFLTLPPDLRARFNNDPNALIHFMSDPSNATEAERLGLTPKTPELDRTGTPVPQSAPPATGTTMEQQ